MTDQARAIVYIASAALALLAGLLMVGEIVFTKPLNRPSRWSGCALCSLVAAFAALTVGDWPILVELWKVAVQ